MFDKTVDQRLSLWYAFRSSLENDSEPLASTWNFWKNAPFIPFNHKIDRYNNNIWPTPWEIIVENKYDDFTKALMIGWTIKLTERFKNNCIELKSIVDNTKNTYYNIVCVDNFWVINYSDIGPVKTDLLPKTIFIEYLIELTLPK
jgi:hypothetical protein